MFNITGNGDVLESHDGVLGVGSGSTFAIAAARAQMDNDDLSAEDVAKKAMQIGKFTGSCMSEMNDQESKLIYSSL